MLSASSLALFMGNASAEEATLIAKYNEFAFNVTTSMSNGAATAIQVSPDFTSITIDVRPADTQPGDLIVTLPRDLIDAKDSRGDISFVVLAGITETDYEQLASSESERQLKISVPARAESIEIIGTTVVPEFPIGMIGAIAAGIGTGILVARTKLFNRGH